MNNRPPDYHITSLNLVDLLRGERAGLSDRRAYTFLADGENESAWLSYADLDAQARAIAAELQDFTSPGDRALLLYPPGLGFITAFFGCLYARVIAVPAYPPNPARIERSLERLIAVADDCHPAAILSPSSLLSVCDAFSINSPRFDRAHWLATDAVDPGSARRWREPGIRSGDPAFLQYTSGSTAAPKGVIVTHGNLIHNSGVITRAFGHGPDSRGVIWLPPYHDMGLTGGIIQPLYAGFPVVLMPPLSFLQRPLRWLAAISRCGATTSGGPNFAYDLCVRQTKAEDRAALDLSRWITAFNGAEPVRPETMARFAAAFTDSGFRMNAFVPCYGLAESTLMAASRAPDGEPVVRAFDGKALEASRVVNVCPADADARALASAGPPAPDQLTRIVDPNTLRECPAGEAGEIWLSSPSVASGYWNRPDLTAETFYAAISDTGEGPFLRTGDLGFLHGGELFITGRIKDLVIIRGRNHDPGDIEMTVEQSHPALRPGCGAAFTIEIDEEERLVVAYEVDRRERAPDAAGIAQSIRQAVAGRHELQVYAVALVRHGHIPKTASGKIQRHACRAGYLAGELELVGVSTLGRGDSASPPPEAVAELTRDMLLSSAPEARPALLQSYLAASIARALKIDPVLIDAAQPINSLGLDSLMAVELQHAVETGLEVSAPMSGFLDDNSLEDLAARLLVRICGQDDAPGTRRIPVTDATEHPLSFSQEALWVLDQMSPGSPAYNIPIAVNLTGSLDAEALSQSLADVVHRHAALRTVFTASAGIPMQIVSPAVALSLPIIDLSSLPETGREAGAERLALLEARRPFDLASGPLIRAGLIRLGETRHTLLLTMHHIVSDGWSMGVLVREITALYAACIAGEASPLAAPEIQYPGFARWQRERVRSGELDPSRAYWTERLHGAPPPASPPPGYSRPEGWTGNGATHRGLIPRQLHQDLNTLSRREGATLFMTLFAAFTALLHRYTGEEDVVIGTRSSGRVHPQTADMIGFFVNALPLRVALSGDAPFSELLGGVRAVCVGAYANQDLPFEEIAGTARSRRPGSHHPLIRSMFVLRNFPLTALALPGLTMRTKETGNGTAKFDIDFSLAETPDGLAAAIEYSTDLYEVAAIARMLSHYQTMLEAIAADPQCRIAALPLMTDAEKQQLLADWSQSEEAALPKTCLHELFTAQASRTPGAVAVACGPACLSYQELNRRANRLARHLQALGAGPEIPVGVYLGRGLNTVVALLAILKAGAAYVPLDPEFPTGQIAFMLADTLVPILITSGRERAGLPPFDGSVVCLDRDCGTIARWPAADPVTNVTAANLSHIMYTSGSTGQPKGVMVMQRQLINRFCWMWRRFPFAPGEVACQRSTVNFSVSLWELLGPLLQGVHVVIFPDEVAKDPDRLIAGLTERNVTRILLVPSLLRALLDTPAGLAGRLPNLNNWMTAGEPLSRGLYRRFREEMPNARLINDFGATEVHGVIAYDASHHSGARGCLPIGRPIANTRIYLLDELLDPVPVGIPGLLHVDSIGLARGYLGRPGLTAARFVPHPYSSSPGARLYNTGDIARYLPDGEIEYLGRRDHQVKVRGIRVEVEGVETILRECPGVKQAVVAARVDSSGDTRLVAYVVPHSHPGPTAGGMRRFMELRAPAAMAPAAFEILDALPLLPNGKIDRRGLPEPSGQRPDLDAAFEPARTGMERTLAAIWREVLRVERVGVNDNFFDLGGHSLLMIDVLRGVQEVYPGSLTLLALFQYPTISALARHLSEEQPSDDLLARSRARVGMKIEAVDRRRRARQALRPG